MELVTPFRQDILRPTLLSSESLAVSQEQKDRVRDVLDICCSDSKFAEKAYLAIQYILTNGSTKVPVVSSLTPNSAEIGDPSFTLHVHGTNFNAGTKIIFNGGIEPTTVVGPTEVTTIVNMDTVSGPVTVPVMVQSSEGLLSNPMNFSFTDGIAVLSMPKSGLHPTQLPAKPPVLGVKPTNPIVVPPKPEPKDK